MLELTPAKLARGLGVRSVRALDIDGAVAVCCAGRGAEEEALRAVGVE